MTTYITPIPIIVNPGTPSNTTAVVSTAGVLTPAMLLATSYANAISTAAADATTKAGTAYANATTYTANVTGAISRTVSSRLSDTVNLKDFNAVGDGIVNDSAAINLAKATNIPIYLPRNFTFLGSSFAGIAALGSCNFYGSGQIKLADGNKVAPIFTQLTSAPTSIAPAIGITNGFNGDLSRSARTVGSLNNINYAGTILDPGTSTTYKMAIEVQPDNLIMYLGPNTGRNEYSVNNQGRTGIAGRYTNIQHYGRGDAFCNYGSVYVAGSNNTASNQVLEVGAGVLLGGQVLAGANDAYLNCIEVNADDLGYRASAGTVVTNHFRSNADRTNGNFWLAFRAQSGGTVASDSAFSAKGTWNFGLDVSSANITSNAAITLATNQRIYGSATSGTFIPANTGNDWIERNSSGYWNIVYNNISSLHVNNSLIEITGALTTTSNTLTIGTAAYHVANGNMGIGTASPIHPLQVAGNTFITGSVGIGSSVSAVATVAVSKTITGGVTAYGIIQNGSVQNDVTTAPRGFYNILNIASANSFTMNQYTNFGTQASKPAVLNATINNLYGYIADSTLVSGIANYGFLGSLPASSASTITNISLTSNVVTVTASAAHSFWPGQTIVIAATTTTSINGSFTILTCPSTTTFTYALVLGDIASTADTGTATVSTGRWNAYMSGNAPNYFSGQIAIGSSASLTNGYLAVNHGSTTVTSQLYVGGTNLSVGLSSLGLYVNCTLTGTSALTSSYGITCTPLGTLSAGATVSAFGGINNQPTLNSTTTPTSFYGTLCQLGFGAATTGGTVAAAIAYYAAGPSFNAAATTNMTTYVGFRAGTASNGALNTITNIFAFQGQQNTTASSNAYNLFMSGTAKNYLAGNTGIGNTLPDATLAVTGTANVSGAVAFGSTLNVIGNLTTNGSINTTTATGKVIIGTDSGGSLSLGRIDGTASAPYIDFNSGATAVDYDARISVSAGNGTVGAATLTIAASTLAHGNTNVTGFLTTSSYSKTTATIVGSLVAAATAGAGARSFVTDSTVAANGNFGAIVAGTGANPVPVYSDGTNWRIG